MAPSLTLSVINVDPAELNVPAEDASPSVPDVTNVSGLGILTLSLVITANPDPYLVIFDMPYLFIAIYY